MSKVMRHRVKKIKIKLGKDHNKMLMRKMTINFLKHNKITTTLPRAKLFKSYLERLVYKSRERTESNKNVLLKHLGDMKWVNLMFDKVGPFFKDRVGGYVRIVRLLPRASDGAKMARVEWVEVPGEKKNAKTNTNNKTS